MGLNIDHHMAWSHFVQKMDDAIHRTNRYQVYGTVWLVSLCPLDSVIHSLNNQAKINDAIRRINNYLTMNE